jgi:CsoR family transcriptional regulator, copper-sensing transcriptional repressor
MSAQATKESRDTGTKSCCCHHKNTPRSEEMQADLQKRLNRVIGQLNGVKSMIDDNRYCGDVLIQLSAAESAVHSISAILLQNHLETCVVEQIEQGNADIIDEAMQLIKKFAR